MEWSATVTPPKPSDQEEQVSKSTNSVNELDVQIKSCGDKVRDLKAKKAEKVKYKFFKILFTEYYFIKSSFDLG